MNATTKLLAEPLSKPTAVRTRSATVYRPAVERTYDGGQGKGKPGTGGAANARGVANVVDKVKAVFES